MKKAKLFLATVVLAMLMCMNTYAGQWLSDDTGWWYQNTDGSYLKSGWYWINGSCYLFNDNGYIYTNTTTPDGYEVNGDGAWANNGVAQTIPTELAISNLGVTIPNGYEAEVDTANSSISIIETNGLGGALLMNVNEPSIAEIRNKYGEESLVRVSNEVAGGLVAEIGTNPILLGQDVKQYPNGVWYHYTYNVNNKNNGLVPCNVYINFLEQDARIVILINNNREFTEDQFMMYYVK